MELETNTQAIAQTREDLKNSVLIVSVLVNLFLFTAWLVVEASPYVGFALVTSN